MTRKDVDELKARGYVIQKGPGSKLICAKPEDTRATRWHSVLVGGKEILFSNFAFLDLGKHIPPGRPSTIDRIINQHADSPPVPAVRPISATYTLSGQLANTEPFQYGPAVWAIAYLRRKVSFKEEDTTYGTFCNAVNAFMAANIQGKQAFMVNYSRKLNKK